MQTIALFSLLLLVAIFNQAKSQAITGLQLINTLASAVIGPLNNGDTLSLATLPPSWTIVASATSLTKSVAFNLDGNSTYHTENAAPWSMTGDVGVPPQYFAWNPVPLGGHNLILSPFPRTQSVFRLNP
jgi:hypothetical protein